MLRLISLAPLGLEYPPGLVFGAAESHGVCDTVVGLVGAVFQLLPVNGLTGDVLMASSFHQTDYPSCSVSTVANSAAESSSHLDFVTVQAGEPEIAVVIPAQQPAEC